jgi:hypothetical protein
MTTFQNNMHVHYSQETEHLNVMLIIKSGESSNYQHSPCDVYDETHTRGGAGLEHIPIHFKKA